VAQQGMMAWVRKCVTPQRSKRWVSLLTVAILFGCVAASPPLSVVVESPVVADRLWVRVKPIVTRPFSDDRKRFGMDLSAYYTPIEIQVNNPTRQTVRFDAARAQLTDQRGKSYAPLNEKESLQRYRAGGWRSGWTFGLKSSSREERETQMIVESRMLDAELQPGEVVGGLLYFRKVHPQYCGEMVLTLPFAVADTEEAKIMTFRLSCAP